MPTPPLEILTTILRRALFVTARPDYTAILPLVRQALAFFEREAQDAPATWGHASDLATLLAAMIEESQSPAFVRAGLTILLRLGHMGESLAVSFAGKEDLSTEHMGAVLGSLPGDEKLLLANAILRFPRNRRPELSRFATGVLEAAIDQDPDDVLVLLDTLRLRGEEPSSVVRDICLHGRLGLWLTRLVKMDLYPEQVNFLSHIAAVLRSSELAEPLLRAARAADDPARVALCRAVSLSPCPPAPSLAQEIENLAGSDDPAVVLAALAALSRLDSARAAGHAAAIYRERPDQRPPLAAVPLFLPRARFPAFVRDLPEADRPVYLHDFLLFLARGGDECLHGLVRQAGTDPGNDAGTAALLDALNAGFAEPEEPLPPPPRKVRAEPLQQAEAEGFLGKLKSLVGLDKEQPAQAKKISPLDSLATGGELTGLTISEVDRPGIELRDAVFTKVTLENVDLSRCGLGRVVFRGCRLRKVDLTLARLAGVRFEACRLDLCRFSGVSGSGLTFSGCDLSGVWLDDAQIKELRLDGCEVRECTLFGSRLTGFETVRTALFCVNFTAAVCIRPRFLGTDMDDCTFAQTVLQKAQALCCHIRGASFHDCRIDALRGDEPVLLAARDRSQTDRLVRAARVPSPRPTRPPSPAMALAGTRLAESWYFDTETRHRLTLALAHNRRRLDWALEKLGEADGSFLRCLPTLLEAPRTWSGKGWVAAVAARIPEYHAGFTAFAGMQNIMGEACPPHAPAKNALTIKGLYAMGSLGTVAQGQASDMDIWVCLADDGVSRSLMDRFRKKLDGLRALAASRGIEAHFFVMTESDIRENRLGFGDEELCGQARAMLLKEEFLRTALFLAGRIPAWWMVTPGSDDTSYARTLARLSRPDAPAAACLLDTGNVRRVADEAFLGASLWIIVKSLQNPFKSIMKFALLEKYLAGEGRDTLLCDRIKKRLFAGRSGLFDTDPYVLLFDEVKHFHEARESRETLALLRLAFLQKTGVNPLEPSAGTGQDDQPGHLGGEGLFRAAYGFDLDECQTRRRTAETAPAETPTAGGLAEAMAVGKKIAEFMSGTYERIRERLPLRGDDTGQDSDHRDLAMFGRRIASWFGARKNKISRIPFVRPPRDMLHAIEIVTDAPEQGFTARGECRGPQGRRPPEHIRSERSLERLGAWLTANGLYHQGIFLKAATLKAPVSLPDIKSLFGAMAASFPMKATFDPPLSEGLTAERITRALFVINMHVPREERELAEVGLLYSTNWGELFFLETTQAMHLLTEAPHDFVRYNTGLPVDPLARLETFTPAKAACPKIATSFYT